MAFLNFCYTKNMTNFVSVLATAKHEILKHLLKPSTRETFKSHTHKVSLQVSWVLSARYRTLTQNKQKPCSSTPPPVTQQINLFKVTMDLLCTKGF